MKTLDTICKTIADFKFQKAAADKESAACSHELENLYDKLKAELDETGQPHWYVKGVGTFTPSFKELYSIVDQEKLKEVLEKAKLTDLIKIHPQVITEWARNTIADLKEADNRLPEKKRKGYDVDAEKLKETVMKMFGITFYEKSTVSFTKKEGKYAKGDSK